MKYRIKKQCARKINSFYHNVAKKYKHTYSEELMHKNIDEAVDSIYQIEQTLLRREPTITRIWQTPINGISPILSTAAWLP